jgi:colicin import membrane protein
MRAGLVVSAVGHAGLIALAIVGIGMTRPFETPPVESIAVDLISVEEFSNIRKGSLDSTIVETETPSIVDTETPAVVAQPTGNTEENQTTPEDTAVVTPAPTQETAPEPVPLPQVNPEPAAEPEPEPVEEAAPPVPEPEPQPEPVVEPPPEPEPAPVPEPAPEPEVQDTALATPTPAEDPTNVAPVPAIRTASLEEKRAEFKKKREADKKKKEEEAKKKEEERIREAKRKEDQAAKLADEVANIINTEESRGATTGEGGQATLGKETGQAARLSQSEMDALVAQIRDCLSVPLGAAEAGVMARLSFDIDAAGNVPLPPVLLVQPTTTLEQTFASAASRAIQRCGPYLMAKGQSVAALFDPRQF